MVKTWHTYVDVARQSVVVGDSTEGMNVLVKRLVDEQGLPDAERAAMLQDTESRKILFWNGYERESRVLLRVTDAEDCCRSCT
jgi:hypothetical protein